LCATQIVVANSCTVELRVEIRSCGCREGGQGKCASGCTKNKRLDHFEKRIGFLEPD
jgi:hypothetical protein